VEETRKILREGKGKKEQSEEEILDPKNFCVKPPAFVVWGGWKK